MPEETLTIAFVSGKGGVGKTMLASNFSWICSQLVKTLLVDVDFQNQGATGLFAPHVRFSDANALGCIRNLREQDAPEPVAVAERVFFLPSVGWKHVTSQDEITRCVNEPGFQERLAGFVQKMHEEHRFGIVVLDCHGGVDTVSLAAFQTCDYVIMVTEADSVTFNGTLELLNYYEAKSNLPINSVLANEFPKAADGQDLGAGAADTHVISSPGKVKFIVNRVPSKYRWKDLDRIYREFMRRGLGKLSVDESVFCFIPVEESLADSFGEYPFHAKLAPNSIFAKKICFMVHSLAVPRFRLGRTYKPLAKFEKPRYRKRVERVVISYEQKNIQYILKFFAWFSTLLAVGLLIATPVWVHDYVKESSHPNAAQEILQNIGAGHIVLFLSYLVGTATLSPLLWYPMRATFGLMFLYRDKHRFQKALFRAIGSKLSLWQRLSLAKLFILRVGTTFIPAIIVAWVLFLIILLTYSELTL